MNASYYAPLSTELLRLAGGRPLRVEVPLTEAHWESVYLPEHPLIMLARGWERQLDTRYDALFYGSKLSASAYKSVVNQKRHLLCGAAGRSARLRRTGGRRQ